MAEVTIQTGDEAPGSSDKPSHPDTDAELEMTQVVRVDGTSGMFWVSSDYSEETPVMNKSGVPLDPLDLG
ncbi:MAG: hypothetical protein ABEL76_00070 [Bradymonadaceae bacterium]